METQHVCREHGSEVTFRNGAPGAERPGALPARPRGERDGGPEPVPSEQAALQAGRGGQQGGKEAAAPCLAGCPVLWMGLGLGGILGKPLRPSRSCLSLG